MNLWRLEWLRLRRTWRGIGLLTSYLFFGLTGPLLARYLSDILERVGTEGLEVRLPDPRPADGLLQYVSSAQEIGIVAVIATVAGGLAIDATPELATYLRTRVSPAQLLITRYIIYALVSSLVFALGALAAWYQTTVVLGSPPAQATALGIASGMAYYLYLVAIVAFAASLGRSVLGAVLISFGIVLLEPVLGLVKPIQEWLPGQLGGAMVALVNDEMAGADLLRPLAVAAGLAILALLGAIRISARREI